MGDIDRQTIAGRPRREPTARAARFGGLATQIVGAHSRDRRRASSSASSETENAELLPAAAPRTRRARHPRRRDPAVRAGVRCCTPSSGRSRSSDVLDAFLERSPTGRPLRVLLVPAHRDGAHEDQHAAARRRAAQPAAARSAAGSTTSCSPNGALSRRLRRRHGRSRRSSRRSTPGREALRQPRLHRRLAPRVRHQPHRALPRDGVRASRGRRARGARARSSALIEQRGWRISFPIEVRSAAADDLWMSTAYGRDTGYIAVHRYYRETRRSTSPRSRRS